MELVEPIDYLYKRESNENQNPEHYTWGVEKGKNYDRIDLAILAFKDYMIAADEEQMIVLLSDPPQTFYCELEMIINHNWFEVRLAEEILYSEAKEYNRLGAFRTVMLMLRVGKYPPGGLNIAHQAIYCMNRLNPEEAEYEPLPLRYVTKGYRIGPHCMVGESNKKIIMAIEQRW